MERIENMRAVQGTIGDDLVICNQGGNGQDWHELRPHNAFYLQHSMGLTTAVALGLALAQPGERIWAFEGDGGLLMSLGMLAVIARARPANLKVIVFDNENHECGGPFPTHTRDVTDLAATALANGWDAATTVTDPEAFASAVEEQAGSPELRLVVAKIAMGTAGSPMTIDAVETKHRFVRDVERKLGIEIIHPPEHYSTTF